MAELAIGGHCDGLPSGSNWAMKHEASRAERCPNRITVNGQPSDFNCAASTTLNAEPPISVVCCCGKQKVGNTNLVEANRLEIVAMLATLAPVCHPNFGASHLEGEFSIEANFWRVWQNCV